MNMMERNKPSYPLGRVKQAIKEKNYEIDEDALENAQKHFGWRLDDIEKAFLKLQHKDFASSKRHFTNPDIWLDHYRAYGLLGEDVYTHFHFEEDTLQITSLKRR